MELSSHSMKKPLLALLLTLTAIGCSTPSPDIAIDPYAEAWPTVIEAGTPTDHQIRKAKDIYRALHPECEVCGVKRCLATGNANSVHHRIPVHVRPDLATNQMNLITLCLTHHFWIGHLNNYHDYNTNLTATIEAVKNAYLKTARSAQGRSLQ
jgi:hypothetical protein